MLRENVSLKELTRFALGGPARHLADVSTPEELAAALASGPHTLIGGGSNLVASDEGFPGTVIRYTASELEIEGQQVRVGAGVVLQTLVDATVFAELEGLHTMTGIPGWVGGAVYGNAGAYGHSIHEFIESVRYFDGSQVQEIGNPACEFRYRESIFKRRKDWVILEATLRLPQAADPAKIRSDADRILKIRNEKYPPTLKCAGSIFKNLILADLTESVRERVPPEVVREGKVASAYFLEQVGAKGMFSGDIRVADYHANLIYNTGHGTAAQVRHLIESLKSLVQEHYGLVLEEEVQYI
ncbi:MAG: UDP-N-acetylmuramate dehydrogenase [Bryobacteraceae bacterium]